VPVSGIAPRNARRPKALPPDGDSAFFASGGGIWEKKKGKVFTS